MSCKRLLIVILAAAELGCRKQAEQPRPRYAVVRFENLSGDASLDWTGRAASEVLATTLAGALDGPVLNPAALGRQSPALGVRPPGTPGISGERAEALLAGATRLISGYVERNGNGLRITAVEEDLSNGKTIRTVSAEGATPLAALQALPRALSPAAKPYLTSNREALQLYARALEDDTGAGQGELEQALHDDPGFGPAWLALARVRLLKGDRSGAEEVIAEASKLKLDPVSAAGLDLEAAQLKGDTTAEAAAEKRLSALSPGDTVLLRALAEREMAAGQFAAAAADWKTLAGTLENDVTAWNSLAYAEAYAGDYQGARDALNTYRRLRPNDPNLQDSTGDIDYTFGRYSDAGASYLAAYGKNPSFLRGGDLYKAAWAKFRTGDKAGADAEFARFRDARAKEGDRMIPLMEADWLYRTGREAQGLALLRKAVGAADANAPLRSAGFAQLAVWDLLAGDRAKAREDADASGPAGNAALIIVRFSVQPSADAPEWKSRAARMTSNPALAPLQRAALAYALVLDGKRAEALPLWEEIVRSSPATDFFSRAVLAALEGKKPERPVLPDPNSVNPFGALASGT